MAARYHSPDVMIAASSIDAIERGEYVLVLGELHIAHNTLGASSAIAQCPFAPELFEALNLDLPAPRLVPITPRNWHLATSRTRPALVSSRDFRLMFAPDACGVPPARAVPIGALVIEPEGEQLVARSRDGRLRFDIIEVFASLLSDLVANFFNIVPKRPYTPRLQIDRLVVRRETWNVAPAALPFVNAKSEAERFIEGRRWARQQGLPRWVFVKVPGETKPFYLDWDSPIYVEIFGKMIRQIEDASADLPLVSISEMLPQIDQLWLPDAQGERYTSELRLVAVDTIA